jgi:glycine/D-amino acid oxidase-like deaminating enzyme
MKPAVFVVTEASVQLGMVIAASVGLALADVSVNEGVIGGGITGAVVVIGGAVVNWFLRVRKDSFENSSARAEASQAAEDKQAARDRKVRRDALDEWQQTVRDLRTDRELDRKEMHALRDAIHTEKAARMVADARLDECERDRAELRQRVEALENK